MKLLITGAGGQLGKEWVLFCEHHHISYVSFDSEGFDITNQVAIREKLTNHKPDVVINCAAYTKVDQAEEEKDLAREINAEAVGNLATLCLEFGAKLVHYSTDYVFPGRSEDKEKYPNGYPETAKTDPINTYGLTKRDGELAIFNSECTFLLLRVSWLCGAHGNNFVKTMLRIGKEREELNVVNDQFGSPTFTDQVVEQTYTLLKNHEEGVYHLSSSGITTWYHFAKEIFSRSGLEVKVNPVSSSEFVTKAIRPAFSKLSTQKISTIPGIKLKNWQEGLTDLIEKLVNEDY